MLCMCDELFFSRWAFSSYILSKDEPKSRQVQKTKLCRFLCLLSSYITHSLGWARYTCQALMDFLFRHHQTSFILSSFQTFLLKSSIKVECVQGTVKDLNWNARRQTQQSGEMVRDSQIRTSSYWSLKQKLPSDAFPELFSSKRNKACGCLFGWEYILWEGIIKIILNRNISWVPDTTPDG